jgi:hypothetical protein
VITQPKTLSVTLVVALGLGCATTEGDEQTPCSAPTSRYGRATIHEDNTRRREPHPHVHARTPINGTSRLPNFAEHLNLDRGCASPPMEGLEPSGNPSLRPSTA